jgi:hypothetical protein
MCTKCHKKSDYSRGLCKACYMEHSHTFSRVGNANTAYLIECCKNGVVKELLEYGMRYEDLAEKFEVSHGSIQKYITMYGLYKYSKFRRCLQPKFRVKQELNLSDAQKLALCTPWVKNETPRYYLPI